MSIEGRPRKVEAVDLCSPSPTVPPMPLCKISRSGWVLCSPGCWCRVRVRRLALTNVPLPSGSLVSRGGSCGKCISSTRDDDEGRIELRESEESKNPLTKRGWSMHHFTACAEQVPSGCCCQLARPVQQSRTNCPHSPFYRHAESSPLDGERGRWRERGGVQREGGRRERKSAGTGVGASRPKCCYRLTIPSCGAQHVHWGPRKRCRTNQKKSRVLTPARFPMCMHASVEATLEYS
jgi:hypothetical protein